MDQVKRRYLVYLLMSTLDWMGREEDWHERSRLVTRALGLIRSLGETMDAILEMDVKYMVTDYNSFRQYKDRLNYIIDINDRDARQSNLIDFYIWLHEIKLLKENE